MVGPVLVTVEPARIPKPQANGGGVALHAVVEVVKLHLKLAANPLPNWSCAPVLMVAVYWVFRVRGFVGLKVAVSVFMS
jgi:hypothetical protein